MALWHSVPISLAASGAPPRGKADCPFWPTHLAGSFLLSRDSLDASACHKPPILPQLNFYAAQPVLSQRFLALAEISFRVTATLNESRSMVSGIAAMPLALVGGLGSSMLRSKDVRAWRGWSKIGKNVARQVVSPIRAVKPPRGVDVPSDEPNLPPPLFGFTENAEVWNARASLIGILGIIIAEAILNQGLLEAVGIDVGKGLDLPL